MEVEQENNINMEEIVKQVMENIVIVTTKEKVISTAARKQMIRNIKYNEVMIKIKTDFLKRDLTKMEKQKITSCIKICKNELIINLSKEIISLESTTKNILSEYLVYARGDQNSNITTSSNNNNADSTSTTTTSSNKFIVLTAYTQNYTIGTLCSAINKKYCNLHNYQFVEEKIDPETLPSILGNRNHCTWYKVYMILKFMRKELSLLSSHHDYCNNKSVDDGGGDDDDVMKGNTYIAWIDADACVVNDKIRLQDIVKLGENRDLIVAEDQSMLINCGVILIRVCDWSLKIFDEVWKEKKYFHVPHFEQSALIRVLKRYAEGLNLIIEEPYFTKDGGDPIKLFVHTAVLSPSLLNTNVHDDDDYNINIMDDNEIYENMKTATFIYHPYGKSKKVELLAKMMKYRNIEIEGIDPFKMEIMKVNKGYINEHIKQRRFRKEQNS